MRTVQYYNGNEIDEEKISLIKSIAKRRYSDEIMKIILKMWKMLLI